VCTTLRNAGIGADRSYGGRSMKAQMKVADRSGAPFAAIIGEDEVANGEVTLRDLRGDTGQQRIALADLAEHVARLLS
jgi:histidyl-tRNA synthetase